MWSPVPAQHKGYMMRRESELAILPLALALNYRVRAAVKCRQWHSDRCPSQVGYSPNAIKDMGEPHSGFLQLLPQGRASCMIFMEGLKCE
jgi:hypothetical protein